MLNHHYQNPPTVESIIKSNTNKTSNLILFFIFIKIFKHLHHHQHFYPILFIVVKNHLVSVKENKLFHYQLDLRRIKKFFYRIPISNLMNKIIFLFLFDIIFMRNFRCIVSNIECDLTRSAGARYRDSNSDYVNTSQQHYVLYGDRNAPTDSPISNSINHQNEGKTKQKSYFQQMINHLFNY
jgi:hypothetical protein